MADSVAFHLEALLPALRHYEEIKLFTNAEIKTIVKKRTQHEYALSRRITKKIDYLRAIEYEMNLEKTRKKRLHEIRQGIMNQAKEWMENGDKEKAREAKRTQNARIKEVSQHERDIIKRIHGLYQRAMKKFHGDKLLWTQWIDWSQSVGSGRKLGKIVAGALALHPTYIPFWLSAAHHALESGNIASARIMFQRGLRINGDNLDLWVSWFKAEVGWEWKMTVRKNLVGKLGGTTEKNHDDGGNSEDGDSDDDLPTLDDIPESGTASNMDIDTTSVSNKTPHAIPTLILTHFHTRFRTQASLEPRIKMITSLSSFESTFDNLEDILYQQIEEGVRDGWLSHDAVCVLADRYLSMNNGVEGIKAAVERWMEYVESSTPSTSTTSTTSTDRNVSMINYLDKLLDRITEPNLCKYLVLVIHKTLVSAHETHALDGNGYILWSQIVDQRTELFKSTLGTEVSKEKILELGVTNGQESVKKDVNVWVALLKSVSRCSDHDEPQSFNTTLYARAIEQCGQVFALTSLRIESLTDTNEVRELYKSTLHHHYLHSLPLSPIADSYLTWAQSNNVVEEVVGEMIHGLGLGNRLEMPTWERIVEVYAELVQKGKPQEKKKMIIKLKTLFDTFVGIHCNADSYLLCMKTLLAMDDLESAMELNWRAVRALPDGEKEVLVKGWNELTQ